MRDDLLMRNPAILMQQGSDGLVNLSLDFCSVCSRELCHLRCIMIRFLLRIHRKRFNRFGSASIELGMWTRRFERKGDPELNRFPFHPNTTRSVVDRRTNRCEAEGRSALMLALHFIYSLMAFRKRFTFVNRNYLYFQRLFARSRGNVHVAL